MYCHIYNGQDETFEFGIQGADAYEALGPILISSGCLETETEGKQLFTDLAVRLNRGNEKSVAPEVRHLNAPMRMGEGMPEEEEPSQPEEEVEQYFMSERDLAKLERRKRKDDRARQVRIFFLPLKCFFCVIF